MFRNRIRVVITRYFEEPIVKVLQALKVTPTMVTIFGLMLTLGVGYLAAVDELVIAGILMLVSGPIDMLDGALARRTGKDSMFGALLDSICDRLGEGAVLFGLLILSYDKGSIMNVVLVFIAMVASFMVSYIRARGEGLGVKGEIGLMTRPERLIVLSVGMLTGYLAISLILVSVLSGITAGQRFVYISQRAK